MKWVEKGTLRVYRKQNAMATDKKGKKVPELHEESTDALDNVRKVSGSRKAPGQVGLHAPDSIDAIRRPKKENRKDSGRREFGGVSAPQVSDQTYDCYKPLRKVNPPKKKKS